MGSLTLHLDCLTGISFDPKKHGVLLDIVPGLEQAVENELWEPEAQLVRVQSLKHKSARVESLTFVGKHKKRKRR